jgi:hypothetical protein
VSRPPGQSPPSAMQSESGPAPRHRRSPRGVDMRRPSRGSARRGYGIRAPGTEREPSTASSAAAGPAPASGQRGPLDRLSEAAESAPDCLLRRPHAGLSPALGGRERAVLGDEPPKSRVRTGVPRDQPDRPRESRCGAVPASGLGGVATTSPSRSTSHWSAHWAFRLEPVLRGRPDRHRKRRRQRRKDVTTDSPVHAPARRQRKPAAK